MQIVKIGGSIFAPKSALSPTEFIEENCQKIINELKEVPGLKAVVFGAGIFGHKIAEKLKLSSQKFILLNKKDLEPLQTSLNFLNKQLVAPLLPADWQITDNEPNWSFIDTINVDFVPVFFAGIEQRQAENSEFVWVRIISGDEIVAKLAEHLHAKQIVFYTKVAGVVLPDGLKKSFRLIDLQKIIEKMSILPNEQYDCTEGMKGKLNALSGLKGDILVEFR